MTQLMKKIFTLELERDIPKDIHSNYFIAFYYPSSFILCVFYVKKILFKVNKFQIA